MMGQLFIAIGLALLASLLVFPSQLYERQPPEIESIGFGANARYAIPTTEIQAAVKTANTVAVQQNTKGLGFSHNGQNLLLLAIVLGAAISITAGIQRIVVNREKSDALLVALIALLGAGSAVSTSFVKHYEQQATRSYACVDQITKVVRTTLEDLQQETNEELARQYLSEMTVEVQRCDLD